MLERIFHSLQSLLYDNWPGCLLFSLPFEKEDTISSTMVLDRHCFLSNTHVWDAVKQLPAKYSEVVHLFYHEGYSTAQIAALLSKKEATVRSLLQRARIKLKDVLKEVYDFGEQV